MRVDRARCIGSGICAGTAPGHFVLVDGVSRPLAERVAPDEVLVDAADSCPVEAVVVSEVDGLRRIAPEP
ncbi:ferredoxin [Micromonospora citrea]|uniref:Ferredoxin n=1 Tax=Micromonospora citrea TaxID=47855 RepID=A0A1C6USA8_9ACTN|nr:ferredoxin [Micromonospora citrea]